jgi:hypothetical protein
LFRLRSLGAVQLPTAVSSPLAAASLNEVQCAALASQLVAVGEAAGPIGVSLPDVACQNNHLPKEI